MKKLLRTVQLRYCGNIQTFIENMTKSVRIFSVLFEPIYHNTLKLKKYLQNLNKIERMTSWYIAMTVFALFFSIVVGVRFEIELN